MFRYAYCFTVKQSNSKSYNNILTMKKFLLVFSLLNLSYFSLNGQRCVIVNDVVNGGQVEVLCIRADLGLEDGDEIELTEEQLNDATFLMSLFENNSNLCNGGGTLDVIRKRRSFRDNIAVARNNTCAIRDTIRAEVACVINGTFTLDLIACVPNPSSIPTLSQWGLLIFGLLVLNIGSILVLVRGKVSILN